MILMSAARRVRRMETVGAVPLSTTRATSTQRLVRRQRAPVTDVAEGEAGRCRQLVVGVDGAAPAEFIATPTNEPGDGSTPCHDRLP